MQRYWSNREAQVISWGELKVTKFSIIEIKRKNKVARGKSPLYQMLLKCRKINEEGGSLTLAKFWLLETISWTVLNRVVAMEIWLT